MPIAVGQAACNYAGTKVGVRPIRGLGMNRKEKVCFMALVSIFISSIINIGIAKAENWQKAAVQKDGMGNDFTVIEIDLDSIKSKPDDISVNEKITSNVVTGEGFSCDNGDIRHGLKKASVFCDKPSSENPGPGHEANWQVFSDNRNSQTKFDLNSLFRTKGGGMVSKMVTTISKKTAHYDCKGYYMINKPNWIPLAFNSPEKQVSEKLCHVAE